MTFSQMTSREKTIVTVLAAVIVLALCGIGILAARLFSEQTAGEPPIGIAVTDTVSVVEAAEPTVTPIAAPSLEGQTESSPPPVGNEAVVVVAKESVGPLAPAIITSERLYAGHRYRLEITTADGSQVPFRGNWSQSATSVSGQVSAPQIEFLEGTTPYQAEIPYPVSDPDLWLFSVSAGPRGRGATAPIVIRIVDVTGAQ
jgi:hypothetical protein